MSALQEAPTTLDLRPPEDDRPLGSYVVLMSVFGGLGGLFSLWFRASGRRLPERIHGGDLALITVASHKAARLLAKDRVTSPLRAPFTEPRGESGHGEVEETTRGGGARRVIGELLLCPFCLGMWTSGGFVAGLLAAPRPTRWLAAVFTAFFGSEALQLAYKKAEDSV